MALETGVTYIEDMVVTNPVDATDNVSEGDDHIRLIKTAVQGSFPNLGAAAVTKTAAQINTAQAQVSPATTNNLAMLDASGDLADSLVESDGAGNITANVTGDLTGNADTVTTNANLTGEVTSLGNATTVAANVIGDNEVIADNILFSNLHAGNSNYDFDFTNSDKTEIIPRGIYTAGVYKSSGGAVVGTIYYEQLVDGSWIIIETIAVSSSAFTAGKMDTFLMVSNNSAVRLRWVYGSGGTSSDFVRFRKIFD